MKILSICILVFSSFSLFAQLPEIAEDISPLLISEVIPPTDVIDLEGKSISLQSLMKSQKSILLFYRGGWCPYCNTHLSEVGLAEKEIKDLGFQIIAFSPDSPENLKATMEKSDIQYQLFSDGNGALMKAMGIAFNAPDKYGDMLYKYSDKMNDGLLPVPSLFVVDTEGTILFEYISPNYKQRIGADMLMSVLKQLNAENSEN